MAWYVVVDRATGEAQTVECKPSRLADHYPPDQYEHTHKPSRPPRDDDVITDGKLQKCNVTRARLDREGALARMSNTEFFEAAVAEAVRRMGAKA